MAPCNHLTVPAISPATHAARDPGLIQNAPVVVAGVLAAPIGVVDEIARPGPKHEGFAKGLEHELSIDPLAHRIPHDPSGEEIADHRQVQPAFQRCELRDVGDPCGVGSLDIEVSHQEVRCHGESVL